MPTDRTGARASSVGASRSRRAGATGHEPRTGGDALADKIDVIRGLTSSEADVSSHVRDLLVDSVYPLRLRPQQLQVDTANLPGSARRPDISVFETIDGAARCTPDHMVALIELKRSNTLTRSVESVFSEKKDYIQPATRYFFLLDQHEVWRYDLVEPSDARVWKWEGLREGAAFLECFGVISASALTFEGELERFRRGDTRFGYLSIERYRRGAFIRTVSEVSETLQEAIEHLIDGTVAEDLRRGNALVAAMADRWGAPEYDWSVRERPVEFARATGTGPPLDERELGQYEDDHDRFDAEVRDHLYALQIENELLRRYAERLALGETPSLLSPRSSNGKATPSGKAIASLAYETGALIMSRMLMVRFCEDHGLFTERYISNGGIRVFAVYAEHFQARMQSLLKETYRASSALFAYLFDASLLDWALDRDDERLSRAILRAAYLLSRWDFRTAHGDILSGVYDRYLNTSRRRALGEVYTRPEIARYMLALAGVGPETTVLDPACGTGTFLVEALVAELKRLKARGLHRDVEVLRGVLGRLSGLDINDFAVVLAQIQIIWHLIEALAGSTVEEVRKATRALIPSIAIAGGWSSLNTFGQAFTTIDMDARGGAQTAIDYAVGQGRGRRAASLAIPRKFRRIARAQYDVVVANPPYVRAHRQGGADYRTIYPEVAFGVTDIYAYFIYRSLRHWVRPGGRLAVIVPIAVMDADYASLLRQVLREHRLTHVVDLEALGRVTFRGVKRNTVILVVERSPPAADDLVSVVTVPSSAYDEASDVIDFALASTEMVPAAKLSQETFLPKRATMTPWVDAIERCEGSKAPLLSKLKATDLPVLDKMAVPPRLGSIIATAWTRRVRGEPMRIEHAVPRGEDPKRWSLEIIAGVGLELGGRGAFARSGADIWRGQHIFPGGVVGTPMAEGFYDPILSRPKAHKIYGYAQLFMAGMAYAVRDIAQLPTACRVPQNGVFQNSAVLVQLVEDFPLDLYLLSRVPQWYAARVLRATVLQDFGCHWYKKTIPFIPIPAARDPALLAKVRSIGAGALDLDAHLADSHAAVRSLVDATPSRSLRDLMVGDHPLARHIDAGQLPDIAVPVIGARASGEFVVGDDLLLKFRIDDPDLRTYVAYQLRRLEVADPLAKVDRAALLGLSVPVDALGRIAETIRISESQDGAIAFEAKLVELDEAVGAALGLSPEDIAYVQSEMATDPVLRRMRPMLRQRGIRVQGYAGDDDGDRYD